MEYQIHATSVIYLGMKQGSSIERDILKVVVERAVAQALNESPVGSSRLLRIGRILEEVSCYSRNISLGYM
jgi:hypothetical protein